MTQIVLVDQTSLPGFTDELRKVVAPFQKLFAEFESVWRTGMDFRFEVGSDPGTADPSVAPVYFRDRSDMAGAGGYHLGGELGGFAGYVFAKDAIEANESWTVDASHEILEMAGDPRDDRLVSLTINGMAGYHCLREACDAVESDALGYKIDGVLVTDWVTPAYFFQTNRAGPWDQYDFMNHLHEPAPALLHGGYLGIQDPRGQWGQVSMFDRLGRFSRRAQRHGRHQRFLARLRQPSFGTGV